MIFIRQLLELCSPKIRALVQDLLNRLKSETDKTPNDFDNILTHLLFIILGFPYKSK